MALNPLLAQIGLFVVFGLLAIWYFIMAVAACTEHQAVWRVFGAICAVLCSIIAGKQALSSNPRCPALPLPGLQERLLDHVGHAVRQPQAAVARLSGGHRDLLQRGQGQVDAGAQPRSGPVLQGRA